MSRILLVAHDNSLRESRALILQRAGYDVVAVVSVSEAAAKLRTEIFDVVVVGRNPISGDTMVARALRSAFPDQSILKITNAAHNEVYATQTVDAAPLHFLTAISEMVHKQVH